MPGLDIAAGPNSTIGQNFGSEWPYPTQAQSGWPASSFSSPSQTNWNWMTGVKQVNVSFKGLPLAATTPAPGR